MTILGAHTVAELQDWIAALDFQISHVTAAVMGRGSAHPDFAAWSNDWNAMLLRYGAAHAAADTAIAVGSSLFSPPAAVLPAEGEWQGIERALNPDPGGPSMPRNYQGLYNRASAMVGPIDLSDTPQPRKGTDVDLGVYKAADTTIRVGAGAVHDAAHDLPLPDDKTKILIAAALGLGLVIAAKVLR